MKAHTETTNKATEIIEEIYNVLQHNCDIDLKNEGIDLLDYDIDSLCDYINESNLLDVDIIYYHKAMKYLMENDTSLCESMEIAQSYGYEPKNINSELLASLHATQNNQEKFNDIQEELEELFNKLEEVK
tara:strand:+ start:63 stop:452 length:390 start_codon:yes stop_codon:yes gene_type:complete